MRILHIITALGYGGAERLLVNLANFQAESHRVKIIYLKDEPKMAPQLKEEVSLQKLSLGLNCIKELRKAIVEFSPEVINSHLGHADLLTWQATKKMRIGKVSTLHLVRFKWDWRDVFYAQLYQASLKSIATDVWFTAVSTEFASSAKTDFGIPPNRMKVIYNSVPELPQEMDRGHLRNKFGIESEKLNLLFVGRLHPIKGIDVLFKAIAKQKDKGQNLKLRLAGEGPIRPELEALAKYLGIEKEVDFLGALNNVAEWMAVSDALVLPSLDEGLPTVIIEAYRASLPVIGSKISGMLDVIEPTKTGELFEVGNAEALAKVINDFDYHSIKTQNQILAGYLKWKSQFYLPVCAKELEDYYQKAIDYQKV